MITGGVQGWLGPEHMIRRHGDGVIIEGTVVRAGSNSDFRSLRNQYLRDWDITIEEFEEIFTPY